MKRPMSVVLVTYVILLTNFPTGLTYLLDNRCGMSRFSTRITGGQNAQLMSKPWMVFLHSNNVFLCGGSLIHPWFILTAAHCFPDKYRNGIVWARLGEHNSKSFVDCNYWECAPLTREYLIVNQIRHPYFRDAKYHDIALGKLDRQVIYSESIRPICVIMNRGWEKYLYSRPAFIVSGWGATQFANESSILQNAVLSQVDRYRCHYNYGYNVDYTHICAGDPHHYVGKGDSGSPLGLIVEYNREERFIQFGIVSHHRAPYYGVAVFTNVLSYSGWIGRVIRAYN